MTDSIQEMEPLEPELWFRALEKLAQRQARAAEREVESLLRHAFHLLQLAPTPLRTIVRCDLDEDSFEALLSCGAFDSAALALVGAPAGFAIHCKTGKRMIEARVHLPGQSEIPAWATSRSLASALVGAWSNCLVALKPQAGERRTSHPVPHRPPAESRRKLTGH